MGGHTDLAHYLIVLQHAPSDVHTVIVPVGPWHLLVDICVDSRHFAAGLLGKAQRKTVRDRYWGKMVVVVADGRAKDMSI